MQITIQNNRLSLTVDTLGAQMMSMRSASGCEYLWQGDPAYWADRSPLLFPMIGRLYKEKYSHQGKEYHIGIHGFAAGSEFTVAQQSNDRLALQLCSSPETLEQYPFPFILEIIYQLKGNTVDISFRVHNTGDQTMYFGIGGHPGFHIPLNKEGQFEDYSLVFSKPCSPERIIFTSQVLYSGQAAPYFLEDHCRIPLRHELFDDDAIILKDMSKQIRIYAKNKRLLTVTYPDMPYLGLWHQPKTDAPYVCIEPWSSLPGRQDITEELSLKDDLIRLPAGKQYTNAWSVTINE